MPAGNLREGGALPYTLTTFQLLNSFGREPILEGGEKELVPVLVSWL
jgi:hypothetical protein